MRNIGVCAAVATALAVSSFAAPVETWRVAELSFEADWALVVSCLPSTDKSRAETQGAQIGQER